MKKLQFGERVAIFLDHRELISQAYNENAEEPNENYELKAELFDFHSKKAEVELEEPAENESQSELVKNKLETALRKRKRNKTKTAVPLSKELQEFEAWSHKCLEQLKAASVFGAHAATEIPNITMPRYWEEPVADGFPQMRGANATSTYQTFRFNTQDYLIPPRCRFYNYDVVQMPQLQPELGQFDLIVMDPPWRNKYIRRVKRARQELGYQMLENAQLQQMNIGRLIHQRTLVAIWCTNSPQHQQALLEQLLPAWQLRPLHAPLKWLKVNTAGAAVGPFHPDGGGHKQPFEMLYLACSRQADEHFCAELKVVELLLSVPSIVHSHKPPLLSLLKNFLPEAPACLEIFARYLQPHFTSVGLEVLKLMDKRLYKCDKTTKQEANED